MADELIKAEAAASNHDGNETVGGENDGNVSIHNTVLGLQPDRFTGFFFPITPPEGKSLVTAYIQFQSSNTLGIGAAGRAACTMNIWCEDVDEATVFVANTSGAKTISGRDRTSAMVEWPHPSLDPDLGLWDTGARGEHQRTPSLVAPIQEVLDRPGYSGSGLVVLITQDGVGVGNRQVAAWDHDTLAPATLCTRWRASA